MDYGVHAFQTPKLQRFAIQLKPFPTRIKPPGIRAANPGQSNNHIQLRNWKPTRIDARAWAQEQDDGLTSKKRKTSNILVLASATELKQLVILSPRHIIILQVDDSRNQLLPHRRPVIAAQGREISQASSALGTEMLTQKTKKPGGFLITVTLLWQPLVRVTSPSEQGSPGRWPVDVTFFGF